MDWSAHLHNYCERGLDQTLWAEPLNVLSNIAIVGAAVAAGVRLRQSPITTADDPGQKWMLWGLIALVGVVGVGSAIFHTFATRWALVADVAPITIFMIAYLGYALRRFLGIGWGAIAAITLAFLAAGSMAGSVTCEASGNDGLRVPCFNGSLGYVPALGMLFVVGLVLRRRDATAPARLLGMASAVFLVSLALRTVDLEWCHATELLGRPRGTHALWHVLNGVTLYLLLDAAIQDASERATGRCKPAV